MNPLEIAAYHEAGHAVMRWLLHLPATDIEAYPTGGGYCWGTGKFGSPVDNLAVTLAGYAAEGGYGLVPVNFDEFSDGENDITHARMILGSGFFKVLPEQMEYALMRRFKQVGARLLTRHHIVVGLAKRIVRAEGYLEAEAVYAFLGDQSRRRRVPDLSTRYKIKLAVIRRHKLAGILVEQARARLKEEER